MKKNVKALLVGAVVALISTSVVAQGVMIPSGATRSNCAAAKGVVESARNTNDLRAIFQILPYDKTMIKSIGDSWAFVPFDSVKKVLLDGIDRCIATRS